MKKILYILSDNRSGSTLLDLLLGAHNEVVSLGEVHHLPAYVLGDRSLYDPAHPLNCSCGERVRDCSFWGRVEGKLSRKLGDLSLRPNLRGFGVLRGHISQSVVRHPSLLRHSLVAKAFNGPRVATDSFELFDAIFDVTSANWLVDSSKSATRFKVLYDHAPARVQAVVLGRDYRGVAKSKMSRGRNMEDSVRSWVQCMRQIEDVTGDVPEDRQLRLKYEDLCADPRAELARICRFLGLEFSDQLLTRPDENVHHLGGSPSKFDNNLREIRADDSYKNIFTASELSLMKDIAGQVAEDWGYT